MIPASIVAPSSLCIAPMNTASVPRAIEEPKKSPTALSGAESVVICEGVEVEVEYTYTAPIIHQYTII
jgi:hypothetical protein